MARVAASIRSLKNLIRRYPALEDVWSIISDTPEPLAQSDRTTVIVGTAWLDIWLEFALSRRFVIREPEIFTGNGPLRDMSARILVLHALGLCTDFIRDELNTVREIRNVFAHSASLITFETVEVATACEKLWIPQQYPPDDPSYKRDAKGKFRLSVRMLWVFLSDVLESRKQPNANVLMRRQRRKYPELFPATLPGKSLPPRQPAAQNDRRRGRRRGGQ